MNGQVPGLAAQADQPGADAVAPSVVRAGGTGPNWTAWPPGSRTLPGQEVPATPTVTLIHI